MTYEEIKKNCDEAKAKCEKLRDELYDTTSSYNEFKTKYYTSIEFKEYDKWDALERLNRVPRMRPVVNDFDKECRMCFNDFMETIKMGYISNWDGSGYYGTEDEVSDIGIDIEQMRNGQYRTDFTHIYWYNK